MTLEESLVAYLSADPGVAALAGDRIFPALVPLDTQLPAIAYQRISAVREYTYDSFEDTKAWVRGTIQLSCWSHVPAEAIELGEAVMLALSGFAGDLEGLPVGSATIRGELDSFDRENKMFRRVVDALFMYEEDLTAS